MCRYITSLEQLQLNDTLRCSEVRQFSAVFFPSSLYLREVAVSDGPFFLQRSCRAFRAIPYPIFSLNLLGTVPNLGGRLNRLPLSLRDRGTLKCQAGEIGSLFTYTLVQMYRPCLRRLFDRPSRPLQHMSSYPLVAHHRQ